MSGMNLFNSGNTTAVSGTALASSIAKHQTVVYGDALDTINLGAGWTVSGTVVSYNGHNLAVYNSNTSAAQVLVETEMQLDVNHALVLGSSTLQSSANLFSSLSSNYGTILDLTATATTNIGSYGVSLLPGWTSVDPGNSWLGVTDPNTTESLNFGV
jgi:hypothetical protein